MRAFLLILLVASLLVGAARAQESPSSVIDISGAWKSSTGAQIEIPNADYGPGNAFEILATSADGRLTRYQAVWEGGFRQKFLYETADGATIIGIVMPEGDTIQLSNPDSDWTALWTRTEGC